LQKNIWGYLLPHPVPMQMFAFTLPQKLLLVSAAEQNRYC